MEAVFKRAHEVRQRQQKEYELRQQRVMADLADMQARTDEQTKGHNRRLREYASTYESGIAKGKREWRDLLYTNQVELARRNHALDAQLTDSAGDLQKEIEDFRLANADR